MAIVRQLFKLLLRDAYLSTEVAEAWERIIRDRKIKFCSNLEKTFADRVQDSRWGRPEWLAILQHHQDFINAMKDHAGYAKRNHTFCKGQAGKLCGETNILVRNNATRAKAEQAGAVWRTFYELATLACQARVQITEKEWLLQARGFGKLFTQTYEARNTTPYIHIFVYHLGYFLEHYHGVEKFANYALECKHRTNKIQMHGGTSGFSAGPVEAARQQLNAQMRTEHHQHRQLISSVSRGKKRGWAELNLAAHPAIHDFVVSSTHI